MNNWDILEKSEMVYVEKLRHQFLVGEVRTYVCIKGDKQVVGGEVDEEQMKYLLDQGNRYTVTTVDNTLTVLQTSVKG